GPFLCSAFPDSNRAEDTKLMLGLWLFLVSGVSGAALCWRWTAGWARQATRPECWHCPRPHTLAGHRNGSRRGRYSFNRSWSARDNRPDLFGRRRNRATTLPALRLLAHAWVSCHD